MSEEQDAGWFRTRSRYQPFRTAAAAGQGGVRTTHPLKLPSFRLLLTTLFLSMLHHSVAVEMAAYTMGLSLLAGGRSTIPFAGLGSFRRSRTRRAGWNARGIVNREAEIARARVVLLGGQAAEANLVCLGDKELLFSDDAQAFIMYARQGNHLIALFDPVGPMQCRRDLVLRFVALARSRKCSPAFYQASPELLALCAELGMRGFKLGELAHIRLDAFDMKGKEWASLRRATNRAQRDGLAFEIVSPDGIEPLLPELTIVSDAWLAQNNAREKRFSLGSFSRDYIRRHPAGILRHEGRIVAFVNLLSCGDAVFIDLMRFLPGVHRGVMDLLMVRVIESLKEQGFRTLNLGMAPLSGLAAGPKASTWERAGNFLFENGNRFYNFKGLRAFKSKFDPEWQPRYLVVPGGTNPYVSALAVAVLIAGGFRGIFRR